MTRARRDAPSRPNAAGVLVFVGPLAWATLLLFHPNPEGEPFDSIRGVVDRWLIVHVGQLVLAPLLVMAVWRLLAGLPFRAATVGRAAAVVWAVFFTAYDSIQGIATGLLIRYADSDLVGSEQAGVVGALDYLVSDSRLAGNISAVGLTANVAWITVAIAGAVALHKAGAGKWVMIATCVSIVFVVHVAPAAIGLVAFALAGILRERQKASSEGTIGPTALVGR